MSFPKTVTYKSHKVRDLYCTVCNTFLGGDGSMMVPYHCDCGKYVFDWTDFELTLEPKEKEES